MDEFLQEEMRCVLRGFKENPAAPKSRLPVFLFGRKTASLTPVTPNDLKRKENVSQLTRWHRQSIAGGPSLAPAAVIGAERWLTEQVLESPDRLLFWVRDLDETPIGHIGISGLDAAKKQVELGYLLRGVPDVVPGAMYGATQALIGWAFQAFPIQQISIRVFPSNRQALCLVERCGFAGATEVIAARQKNGSQAPNVVALSLTRSEWMDAHRLARAA